jgi:enamine deaminase RidA (YjgF/YER057c/UK114 family)
LPGKIEKRLTQLGIELTDTAAPAANYVPYVLEGGTLYIAGQVPFWNGELMHVGKVSADYFLEDAAAAARVCGLNLIAQARATVGDLDRVTRIIKVGGFVNYVPDFTQQPEVVNGASDLFVQVFGDAGKHERFAVEVDSVMTID